MRGRKQLPVNVHLIRGTYRRDRHAGQLVQKPGDVQPLAGPPAGLTEAQLDLWRYYVEAAPEGALLATDRETLAAFVVACDLVRQCREYLARDGALMADDGGVKESAASRALARHAALALRYGAELGLTPCSRPRLRVQPKPEPNPFDED